MKKMSVVVLAVLVCSMWSCVALAKPQIIAWQWPATDCDALTLDQSDLVEAEMMYRQTSMPMPSDEAGSCASVVDPDAPADATVIAIDVANNTKILNLKPGQTYFLRMRVSAYVVDNWGSWSVEKIFTVPYGRPDRIIVSLGIVRFTSELISDPIIWLNTKRPNG